MHVGLVIVVGAMLAGGGLLVYLAGGTRVPAVHIMYLPILVGALFFKRAGGIGSAVAAAVVVGPWMPVDSATGEAQDTTAWVLRGGAFVLIGAVAGQIQWMLQHRLQMVNGLLTKITSVHAKTLSTLASTVELRDKPTGGHCSRVAHNSRAVAKALGLGGEDLRTVYWAGLLHDLGKTAVPERILQKPASLSEEEWTAMKRHSAVGAEVLESVSPDFGPIARGVRAHHERWDGAGYPDGVAGERIPLPGRIVTVVDVFEALTSERPYRSPITAAEALEYLRQNAGTQFDPTLVPILEGLYRKGDILTALDQRPIPMIEEPPVALPPTGTEGLAVIRHLPTHHQHEPGDGVRSGGR